MSSLWHGQQVFLVFADPNKSPRRFKLTVNKNGLVSDLCLALAKVSGLDSKNLVATEVFNHRFHKIFSEEKCLRDIMERDEIFVWVLSF